MAKRARLTVNEVVAALDEERDYEEYDIDTNEPCMDGSDDEFGDFDDRDMEAGE